MRRSRQAQWQDRWQALWPLVNRANVALQLVAGVLLVTLLDATLLLRIRAGWRLGPPDQPWPLWLMLALPASVTLLWLTLAILAILAILATIFAHHQRRQ